MGSVRGITREKEAKAPVIGAVDDQLDLLQYGDGRELMTFAFEDRCIIPVDKTSIFFHPPFTIAAPRLRERSILSLSRSLAHESGVPGCLG